MSLPSAEIPPPDDLAPPIAGTKLSDLWRHEDWWAIWLGGFLLAAAAVVVWQTRPADFQEQVQAITLREAELSAQRAEASIHNTDAKTDTPAKTLESDIRTRREALQKDLAAPFKKWLAKPKGWDSQPLEAVYAPGKLNQFPALAAFCLAAAVLFGAALQIMGATTLPRFSVGFICVFLLTTVSFVLAGQSAIKWANLEYPLWGLLVGLSISNTIGTPRFLRHAVQTEFYIKTGLVLLGAEVLMSQLLQLGVPGIFISWIVTPIVLVTTYIIGQRVLKIESKSLNMVISADMSVCGVSAAIATAAACKAKKEELSLAIGISLAFTVVMMVLMPMFIKWVGMSRVVGAAWIGGTIDATGAVAAAGEFLGKDVLPVAATIKMIQNVLIGAIAFAVAVYWVTCVERPADGETAAPRASVWEIWHRFPKFILGFMLASALFSWIYRSGPDGSLLTHAVTGGTKTIREWLFGLAFVSIGLETNFRELMSYLRGGKPLMLYVIGQGISLVLSLAMAYLMFEIVFPEAAAELVK